MKIQSKNTNIQEEEQSNRNNLADPVEDRVLTWKNGKQKKRFFLGLIAWVLIMVAFKNAILTNTFYKYNERMNKVTFDNCQVDNITLAFLKNNKANLEGITLLQTASLISQL